MSGWDFNTGGTSTKAKAEFTKFPVGITRIRVIDDEPTVRWTHWLPKFNRSVNCPGKDCAICEIRRQQKANKMEYTYAMGRRLAMNVINRETGKLEIMEQGVGFFQDLRDLMQDLKTDNLTLLDTDIKVRRRGAGKDDTSYRLDIDEKSPLSFDDKIIIEAKINLAEYFKPHTPEQTLRLVNGESWDEVMKSEKVDEPVQEEQIEIR